MLELCSCQPKKGVFMARQITKRTDSNRIVLRKGEGERPNGTYVYRWTDIYGKRKSVYAQTLDELREKEKRIEKDLSDGLRSNKNITLNKLFDLWCSIKRGLKDNTLQNYKYMYNKFVRPNFGTLKLYQIKKTDVRRFYNHLVDECGLSASTVDSIHTVLHQLFDMAVDDEYIRNNPSSRVLKELKQVHCFEPEKRKALTVAEQELFLNYLKTTPIYQQWYPIFAVMLGTGLRVGEVTGLRWHDIDLDEGLIDVNHTLVYYSHGPEKGCSFNVNTPKTKAGIRKVPMLSFVKEAFEEERKRQWELRIKCKAKIDGFTDFIFVDPKGEALHGRILNKVINRVIRDCNDKEREKSESPEVLLPHFSCHNLRHTFTTRMCEAGVNIKVMQDCLGHKDVTTTLGIYADVTKELRRDEFAMLDVFFQNNETEISLQTMKPGNETSAF